MIRSHEELKARFKKVDADLASQRERFKKELTRLQVKAPEAIRRPERPGSGKGRLEAELAARQRLTEEEIERRVHARQIEWKQERHRMSLQIKVSVSGLGVGG